MEIITDTTYKTLMPSVATIGFFDGVHKGHQYLINQLKEIAKEKNLKSAVITFPVHPRKVLDADYQPMSLSEKDEKLSMLRKTNVDYCILLPFSKEMALLSAFDFMKLLHESYNIKILLIGYDHKFGHDRRENFNDYTRYGDELGMKVIHAKELNKGETGISSSVIRRLITEGNIEEANLLLGYNYFIKGKVIDGHKIGRKIGFPTANILFDNSERILPHKGVYAVYVDMSEKREMKGMINIGCRPTIENGNDISIEVNIFDFNDNIYGKEIKIEFISFIRPEHKFPDINSLMKQLQIDKEKAIIALDKKN